MEHVHERHGGKDRGPAIWRAIQRHRHQLSPGAAAFQSNASGLPQTLREQGLGNRKKISEGVLTPRLRGRPIPALSKLVAAPPVGKHAGHAPFHEQDARRGEARHLPQAVGPITVEMHRPRGGAPTPRHGIGHGSPIGAGGPEAQLLKVLRRIARHHPALQTGQDARGRLKVVHRRRIYHAAKTHPEGGRRKPGVGPEARLAQGRGKGHGLPFFSQGPWLRNGAP